MVQLIAVQFVTVLFLVWIVQRIVERFVHAGKQRNDARVIQQFERFVKRDQLRTVHWPFWGTSIIPEP